MTDETPKRRRGRWWKVVFGLVVLAIVLPTVVLPTWLNSNSGRRWLLSRANQALTPGRLEVATFHFSWFGPTRLSGVVLVDPDGLHAIESPRVRWDRSLGQLLWSAPRFGTLVLEDASLDIKREADGTINVYQTLKPILRGDPRLDLNIVVAGGRLRLRSAGLSEPIVAETVDATLSLAPAPRPLSWRLDLAQADGAEPGGTLSIEGSYDRWNKSRDGTSDLAVRVRSRRWSYALAGAGLSGNGRLDGTATAERRDGRWASTANGSIAGFELFGARLGGDRLRWDQVSAVWDIAETAGTWNVRRLDVTAPVGTLHASGKTGEASRIDGNLDLAAIARQLPHVVALREGIALEKGAAVLAVTGRKEASEYLWTVEARLTDLEARDRVRNRPIRLKSPASVTAQVKAGRRSMTVDRLALATAFLSVEGSGTLDGGVFLSGTIDLAGAQRQLEDVIDFGATRLAGRGSVTGRYRRQQDRYEARVEADVRELHVEGLGFAAIGRDSAALRVEAQGPVAAPGLPAEFGAGTGSVTSGPFRVELTGRQDGAATVWDASVRASGSVSGREVRTHAAVAARVQGAAVAIERAVLSVTPEHGKAVELHAHGSIDRSNGTISLAALPTAAEEDAVYLAGKGLEIRGLGSARSLHAEAAFGGDVSRLAQLIAPGMRTLHGTWTGRASALAGEEGVQVNARLEARDVADDVEGPITVSLDALAPRDSDRLELRQVALTSDFATIQAAGQMNAGKAGRKLILRGTVAPGWEAINRLAARRIDPRAQVTGKPGALSLEADLGDLSNRSVRESLTGEAGFELTGADFFGMRVGATPIVLRMGRGDVWVAPIETTINEGRLHLEPRLALDDENGPALVLGPESSVRDAAINDEVSHRVLSYVAPILESATRVRGRVSVALEDAEFPLGGSAERHASVDGTVTFQDVEFVAGQLVDDLMAVIGREPKASLKLNKPVSLVMADGRIETKGLALPLGNVTEIAFDGWVDFDRRMNMTASLPVTRKMVLGVDFLGDIVEGTKIGVPIRGTLDHPQIDRDALKVGLKDLGKTLLERTAGRGAAELLMRLARPADPNAPPRLTPAERRERRMERRMRRNGRIPPGNEP